VRRTGSNRRRARCTRYVVQSGAVALRARAGANRTRFAGRLAGRALRPDSYRLAATATDAAGNRSRTRRIGFRILP
jgi:hypothetical protein